MSLKTTFSFLFLIVPLTIISCGQTQQDPEIRTVADEQAQNHAEVLAQSVETESPDDLSVSLWATTDLLGDPIGIDMDDSGTAWVTVTNRSRNSEFDIRDVDGSWLIESMKWETVEDRGLFCTKSWHRKKVTRTNGCGIIMTMASTTGTTSRYLSEEIWTVEDASGDGRADRSQLYIRDFNTEVTDVAGTVLNHNGDIFIRCGTRYVANHRHQRRWYE